MVISSTDQEPSRPARKYMTIAVVTGLLPWLGIVARLLTANPLRISFVGIFLWSASLDYLHLPPEVAGKRSFGVSLLVWTLCLCSGVCQYRLGHRNDYQALGRCLVRSLIASARIKAAPLNTKVSTK
jgi:hypothetical protein